jgi:hypothetical protein
MSAYYNQGSYGVGLYSAGYVYGVAGSLPIVFSLHGTFARPVDVVGNLQIRVDFASHLAGTFGISGVLPIAVGIKPALLNGVFTMKGQLSLEVGLTGVAQSGPLWGSDSPCPIPGWGADPDVDAAPPWVPSELCD